MACVYDHVKLLYDQQLYSNVVALGGLVLTVNDHASDSPLLPSRLQSYTCYAESLFQSGQFKKAEKVYKKLQQIKKSVLKSKSGATSGQNNKTQSQSSPQSEAQRECMSDVDIKYQLHLCLVQQRQHPAAMNILKTIPANQRTAKVHMALGKLFHEQGNCRAAIGAYKEVLRECPLALEAAEGLLQLGMKGIEVNALMLDGMSSLNCQVDWLNNWVKAHAHLHSQEYTQAIQAFRQLDERTALSDNVNILVPLGESYYYYGDNTNAALVLQRAHAMEPLQRGLDILSCILSKERQMRELQRLVAPLQMATDINGPEPWIALAYSLFAAGKHTKAAYFAQKAYLIAPRHIEALLLKGQILIELKKHPEAVTHFREAQQICCHRYEPHKGLVDCYIAMHRFREALTIACTAVKQLGQTPRSLTLYASVLMKDSVNVSKAKTLLEKALQMDQFFLPAVYLLAELYEQEMTLELAIALLEKQVELRPTCKLHQMLGDLLARVHEEEKALDHYAIALNLDPNNRRALEGMHRIDSSAGKLDSSYYMPVGEEENTDTTYDAGVDVADSDNENEVDESDPDAGWSDLDIGIH
ncbi:hypothetical protein FOCC_FOCC012542 [Frankliniella occidentalis]|uniref:Anaphase-promoting complex subunit 7 isoform X1 n=1 Tax=Frankliniella occidentalis TaxID=133901 RepID=A0A6J1T529_FRAOC|nr:anaphase-promoting complex subunit 7 isoform X1 [Frankliniella occidentalis]KAE8741890.1 hypothetical protein FOCC_FOCC012542 [Frankliniella occidentalis]